ncbi:hypothetical protein ACIP0I_000396, partial [Salmonella enterica]
HIFISKLDSVLSQRKSGNQPKVTSRTDVQSKVIQAPELKPIYLVLLPRPYSENYRPHSPLLKRNRWS